MVKADMSRDYYGDLEVAPEADEAAIKKAYKKLAIKYHPDRNPGREEEITPRFQAIQSAYEVLLDPEQRRKYNAGRRLGGGSRTSAYAAYDNPVPTSRSYGQKGNPWANAGSQWAPPPKAPPPTRGAPSAGAKRYSNFTREVPTPTRKQGGSNEAEERKSNHAAFEKMRTHHPTAPRPGQSSQTSDQDQPKAKYPVPPRPGFEDFKENLSRAGSQKRNGYMPTTSGGDEPAAASSGAYYTRTNRPVPPPPDTRPVPPPPPPDSTRPNARTVPQTTSGGQPMASPDELRRTPYSTHGGEKTNPFEGSDLHHSRSTRDSGEASDPNIASPQKRANRNSTPQKSKAEEKYTPQPSYPLGPNDETSSDDSGPSFTPRHSSQSRPIANLRRRTPKAAPAQSQPHPEPKHFFFSSDVYPNGTKDPSSQYDNPYSRSRVSSAPVGSSFVPGSHSPFPVNHLGSLREDRVESLFNDSASHLASALPGHTLGNVARPSPEAPRGRVGRALYSESALSAGMRTKADGANEAFTGATARLATKTASTPLSSRATVSTGILASALPLSGETGSPGLLNAFERTQYDVLHQLINNAGSENPISAYPGYTALETTQQYVTRKTSEMLRHGNTESSSLGSGRARSPRDGHGLRMPSGPPSDSSSSAGSSETGIHPLVQSSWLPSFNEASIAPVSSFPMSGNMPAANLKPHSVSSDADGSASSGVPPNTFASSTENISTTFSPQDWHGKFQAGDYFAAGDSKGRSRSESRARSPSKRKNTFPKPAGIDADPLPEEPNDTRFSNGPGEVKFTAEEWAQKFKPQTFAPLNFSSSPNGSKGRPRRTQTGSSVRIPSKVGAAMLDDSDDDNKPLFAASPHESPMEMDIDPPTTSSKSIRRTPPDVTLPSASGARNVPVEPLRPEWRAGDTSAYNSRHSSPVRTGPEVPPRPLKTNEVDSPDAIPNNDEEDFRTNFDDLKNVEPFQIPSRGLSSFSDLTSTLPFTSAASSHAPISVDFTTKRLNLPRPPKAPVLPNIPVDAVRPSASSWESYLLAYKAYMAEYNAFDTAILMHFVARKQQVEGYPSGWLEAFGDTSIGKYAEGLREDVVVREWWAEAAQRHEKAVGDFQWVKAVYRDGISAAGAQREM